MDCYDSDVSLRIISEVPNYRPSSSKADNQRSSEMCKYFKTDSIYAMETISELLNCCQDRKRLKTAS